MSDKRKFLPPWRELQSDGTLGPEYGPKTASAYARQTALHNDWAHRKSTAPNYRDNAPIIHAFMASEPDLADCYRDTYEEIYSKRRSIKRMARDTGLSRSTIKSYVRRLTEKALTWANGGGDD